MMHAQTTCSRCCTSNNARNAESPRKDNLFVGYVY
jgi:hypothetical protein